MVLAPPSPYVKTVGQKSVQSPKSKLGPPLKVLDSLLSRSELASPLQVKGVRNSGTMSVSPEKIKKMRKKSQVNIRLQ
jgi:hypothetical protein